MKLFLITFFLSLYSTHGDLYNSSDPVVILNYKNFNDTILGVENAWIIEFYNSWCGHCINFVPTWRKFAKDVQEWRHTIKVAVLDCSDDENVPLCRDYEVMAYPTLRLFGTNLTKENKGENVMNRSALQDSVIDFLIKEEKSNNGSKSWRTLQKYKGSVKDIFKSAPKNTKHAVIIVEKPGSMVAAAVSLDLGLYTTVYVRSMEAGNSELQNFNSNITVIVIDLNGKQQILHYGPSSREEISARLIKHLHLKKEDSLFETTRSGGVAEIIADKEEGAGDGKPADYGIEKMSVGNNFSSNEYVVNSTLQVHIVDIENALSYALSHEIVLHKVIDGETLLALQKFLHTILKFLPMRPEVNKFMRKFVEYIDRHNDKIHGEDIGTTIRYLKEQKDTRLPERQAWIGCLGSKANYRGYPCGLWTLFHTLTVNAVLNNGETSSYDPMEVLRGIHGYVKYFFSCENCSKNFQKMYNFTVESFVKRPNDEIIWLWKGHNKVNKRLKGDLTEDPLHVKVQFPPSSSCRSCWMENGSFNESEVLKYLIKIYSKNSLSLKGVQNFQQTLHGQNKQEEAFYKNAKDRAARLNIDSIKKLSQYERELKQYSWGFNNTDFSLCVMLYIFSTIMILGCYSMFLIKKRLRRRILFDKFSRTV